MDREKAKEAIKSLVENFKDNYPYYKKLSEPDVETKLVEEIFIKILGWDSHDFLKQPKAYRGHRLGRADYLFKVGEKNVFILEVKKVDIALEKEADKQAVSYALSKKVPFAISTNFEQLRVFCAEDENAIKKRFLAFDSPDDYFNRFDELWLLSKESFSQELLLKRAESLGWLKKRVSIDKELLDDLMHIRGLIANDLEKSYPGNYSSNEKEEIIQRIIDRLIFIRRCEDTGINPEGIVLEELRRLPQNKTYPRLKEIFKTYNDVYNSGLFRPAKDNDCDTINVDGGIIQNLTRYLYESKDGNYIYNFDWIDADVLGQVYEQYLGKILAQTKSGKAKLKEGQAHRKEQGIYYTPTYIVDYIVKNTVGEILKNKKIKMDSIKIIDPACGSGSFLIKAFDYLYKARAEDQQMRLDSQGTYSVKTEILKNNIFGVDLDNKAVEITKLNLLLKAAENKRKLPEELDLHIKHGNSLIDDECVAGLSAFKWTNDFAEGSFDIVIGNPPYVRIHEFDEKTKEYFSKYNSATGQYDIYVLFIEKALKLLREGGLLGFIVSNKFLVSDYGIGLRKVILSSAKIKKIVDVSNMKVFKDASVYPIIIILEKTNNKKQLENNKIEVIQNIITEKGLFESNSVNYNQSEFSKNKDLIIDVTSSNKDILKKIESASVRLGELVKISRGFRPPPKELISSSFSKGLNKYLIGKDLIGEYNIRWSGNYVKYDEHKIEEAKPIKIFLQPKIMIRDISKKFNAYYDEEEYLCLKTIYFVCDAKEYDLKYITGILNSKLMLFYFKSKFSVMHIQGGYLRFRKQFLEQLPMKLPKESQQLMVKLADRMLFLNKELNKFSGKKTAQTAKLEEEIKKTDQEINELVYKIYGITEKERMIIEESLK